MAVKYFKAIYCLPYFFAQGTTTTTGRLDSGKLNPSKQRTSPIFHTMSVSRGGTLCKMKYRFGKQKATENMVP